MIHISEKNSKLGRIHNISLPPITTCRASDCKTKCYALKAWRMYPACRQNWTENLDEYRTDPDGYFDKISAHCTAHDITHFRWHVSGDIPDQRYAHGMMRVAYERPETQFLAFTKTLHHAIHLRAGGEWPGNFTTIYSAWPSTMCAKDFADARVRDVLPVAWYHPAEPAAEPYMRAMAEAEPEPCEGRCDECLACFGRQVEKDVVLHEH